MMALYSRLNGSSDVRPGQNLDPESEPLQDFEKNDEHTSMAVTSDDKQSRHSTDNQSAKDQPDNPSLNNAIPDATYTVDELVHKLGDPGKLQLIWFVFLAFTFCTVAIHSIIGVFFQYTPSFYCNASYDLIDDPLSTTNATNFKAGINETTSNVTFKTEYGECGVSLVQYTADGVGLENTTKTCSSGEWVYDVVGREATIVTDFDLVCEMSYWPTLSSTFYYIGLMAGNIFHGYLSDTIGRRMVILLCLHFILFVSLGVAFSPNVYIFLGLRTLMGFIVQGVHSTSFVLSVEHFSAEQRSKVGAIIQIFWGVGTLYLAGAAWLGKDWRYIQLAMLIPNAFSALSLWYVGESPRWLLTRGYQKRAEKVFSRIAKFNKIVNPLDPVEKIDSKPCERRASTISIKKEDPKTRIRRSYKDLMRTPVMRRRTISLSFIVFSYNLGYFGMTYNNAELAGDRYWNFFLGSLSETAAYIVGTILAVKLGRKKFLLLSLFVGATCCVVSGVIPDEAGINRTLISVFSIAGRLAVSAAYCAAEVFVAELFPTEVRSMGVGVASFAGRSGAVASPLVSSLRYETFSQLPVLIIGSIAFTGALTVLTLPDTTGKILPNTIEEVEHPYRQKEIYKVNKDPNDKPEVATNEVI